LIRDLFFTGETGRRTYVILLQNEKTCVLYTYNSRFDSRGIRFELPHKPWLEARGSYAVPVL